MNLAEFLNKYTGKKVDFDKVYGAQCVDLFRQYCQDVWQIPHPPTALPDSSDSMLHLSIPRTPSQPAPDRLQGRSRPTRPATP